MQYHMAVSYGFFGYARSAAHVHSRACAPEFLRLASRECQGQRLTVSERLNGLVPDFSGTVALESFLIAEPQMMRP